MSYDLNMLGRNSLLIRRRQFNSFASTPAFKNPSQSSVEWSTNLDPNVETRAFLIANGRYTRNVRLPYEKKTLLPGSAHTHKSFMSDRNLRQFRQPRDFKTLGLVKPVRFNLKERSPNIFREYNLPTERFIKTNVFSDGFPKSGSIEANASQQREQRAQLINSVQEENRIIELIRTEAIKVEVSNPEESLQLFEEADERERMLSKFIMSVDPDLSNILTQESILEQLELLNGGKKKDEEIEVATNTNFETMSDESFLEIFGIDNFEDNVPSNPPNFSPRFNPVPLDSLDPGDSKEVENLMDMLLNRLDDELLETVMLNPSINLIFRDEDILDLTSGIGNLIDETLSNRSNNMTVVQPDVLRSLLDNFRIVSQNIYVSRLVSLNETGEFIRNASIRYTESFNSVIDDIVKEFTRATESIRFVPSTPEQVARFINDTLNVTVSAIDDITSGIEGLFNLFDNEDLNAMLINIDFNNRNNVQDSVSDLIKELSRNANSIDEGGLTPEILDRFDSIPRQSGVFKRDLDILRLIPNSSITTSQVQVMRLITKKISGRLVDLNKVFIDNFSLIDMGDIQIEDFKTIVKLTASQFRSLLKFVRDDSMIGLEDFESKLRSLVSNGFTNQPGNFIQPNFSDFNLNFIV